MVIQLGEDPWILIMIMFLELLFVFIPALIASKVEKKPFKEELADMGFHKNEDTMSQNLFKILAGIGIGVVFYLIGGYIIIFFKSFVVENIFGTEFLKEGEKGAINTTLVHPSIIQIIIIIILQVILVGLCEEAFFRGFFLKRCNENMKTLTAILLSSIGFALYHVPPFIVPIKTIITFFGYFFTFGIMLSIVFLAFKNSLIPCVIAHAFFNILILI